MQKAGNGICSCYNRLGHFTLCQCHKAIHVARGMSYSFDIRKLAIRAVHEQDPGELLNRLGLSELMMKGELTYGICESIVNLNNLPKHELALKA